MAREKTYDPQCDELARYFLAGEAPATEAEIADFAAHIQEAVEDWLETRARETAKPEDPDARS